MPYQLRPASSHLATVLACGGLALAVAVAPLAAQAAGPRIAGAPLSTSLSPTAAKLRTIMRLAQEPVPAADPDAPVGLPVTDPNTPGGPADPATVGPVVAPAPAPAPTVDLSAAPLGPPPKRGLGMMITGAVITGAYALPMIGYGAYIIGLSHRIDEDGLVGAVGTLTGTVVLAFGMVGLAVGGPLLGVGAYRFSRYQRWKNGQQVWSPAMNRTAHGTWTTGVSLRF